MNEYTKNIQDFVGSNPGKMYKSTLFSGEQLMLGLNCLEPGQEQHLHSHENQDKFYFVLQGEGLFSVADQVFSAGSGVAIWAPAGVPHGVCNAGNERLVILIGIAPAPSK